MFVDIPNSCDLKKFFCHFTNQNIYLENVLKRDKNNFDLLRLIASFLVIFGHSFALFPSRFPEPIKEYLKFDYSGGLAVTVFFFLSGILVSGSFINAKNVYHYILKRVARIWPGLTVCLLLTVFIVGPLFSTLSLKDYFFDINTWDYLKTNILLFQVTASLPGVFIYNLHEGVNGSIWTLPVEIRCYLFILIVGLAGLFRKKWIFALFALIVIALFKYFNDSFTLIFGSIGANFFLLFLAGTCCYIFRKQIIINFYLSLFLILLWIFIGKHLPYPQVSFYLIFVYTCLVFVSNKFIVSIKLVGDFSYGVFIYGFIVQQIIAYYSAGISAYQSMWISFPASFLIAYFSWFYIEKPALTFTHNYIKKRESPQQA